MSGSFVWYFGLMSIQVLTHLGLFLPSSGNGILSNYTTALISSRCHISLVSLNPPKTYSPWHLTSPAHTDTHTHTHTHTDVQKYTHIDKQIYIQRDTQIYTHTHTHTHTHWLDTGQVLVIQFCLTLCHPMVCPQKSAGKNARVGCHSMLQGIFPIQGLNSGLVHCRQILHHLSYQGSSDTRQGMLNILKGWKFDYYLSYYKWGKRGKLFSNVTRESAPPFKIYIFCTYFFLPSKTYPSDKDF